MVHHEKCKSHVTNVRWAQDDYYLAVHMIDIQVFEKDGFKEGDEVIVDVTIRKVEKNGTTT